MDFNKEIVKKTEPLWVLTKSKQFLSPFGSFFLFLATIFLKDSFIFETDITSASSMMLYPTSKPTISSGQSIERIIILPYRVTNSLSDLLRLKVYSAM